MANTSEVRLEFHGTVWEATKWIVLSILASIVVFPLAWVNAGIARWVCRATQFSDGTVATFRGTGGDVVVWHVILLLLVIGQQFVIAGNDMQGADVPVLIVLYVATLAIVLNILKWFVYNTYLSSGPHLIFTGSFLGLLGWYVAILISAFTIVGWAWVVVAMYRWMARHVKGQGIAIEFRGSGLELLWRSLAVALGSILIVTIPFLTVWLSRWLIQNVVLIRGVETSFEDLIAAKKTPRTPSSPTGPPVFGPMN